MDTAEGPLGELAAGTPFLTALTHEFPEPSAISADHDLRRTAKDTAYRRVIHVDRLLTVAGIPVWLLTVVGGLAALVTGAVAFAPYRGRSRRRAGWAATPPVPPVPPVPHPLPPTAPPGPNG
ncbi:hypothetical protein ACF05L_03630 [Streptomyces bobili]|uniref:hypothetical protein n=1 Tax=Streptomyces bobili TaxID=67280 RepID=UPI0036F8E441